MTHTRQTYKKRVLKAGFNMNTWAKRNGVNRSTIQKQFTGKTQRIPQSYWIRLDEIDGLGLPEV